MTTLSIRTPYWYWSDTEISLEIEREFHQRGKHDQNKHRRKGPEGPELTDQIFCEDELLK